MANYKKPSHMPAERDIDPRSEAEAVAELERRVKEFVHDRSEKERLAQERKTFKIRKPTENRRQSEEVFKKIRAVALVQARKSIRPGVVDAHCFRSRVLVRKENELRTAE